jgi:hypothetical protein
VCVSRLRWWRDRTNLFIHFTVLIPHVFLQVVTQVLLVVSGSIVRFPWVLIVCSLRCCLVNFLFLGLLFVPVRWDVGSWFVVGCYVVEKFFFRKKLCNNLNTNTLLFVAFDCTFYCLVYFTRNGMEYTRLKTKPYTVSFNMSKPCSSQQLCGCQIKQRLFAY